MFTKEIREMLEKHLNVIIMYTHNSLVDEDGSFYKDKYYYEFSEYIDRVESSFRELIYYQQITLTVETIMFILEYEMIGETCEPHEHKNPMGMESLATNLFEIYKRKVNGRNKQK